MDITSSMEHAREIQSFWLQLTGERLPIEDALEFYDKVDEAFRRIYGLRIVASLKNAPAHVKRAKLRHELKRLIRDLQPDIPAGVDPIEWEIARIDRSIDLLPSKLPYLDGTNFRSYITELGDLMTMVASFGIGRHNDLLRLLDQVRQSPDIQAIAQFCCAEMVNHYDYLRRDWSVVEQGEARNLVGIYRDLCGIYEKDVSLIRCVVMLSKDEDTRYADVRGWGFDGNFGYVRRWANTFSTPYKDVIRNAAAHMDFSIHGEEVRFNCASGQGFKLVSCQQVVHITQDMSALVSVLRLATLILARRDWIDTRSLLTEGSGGKDALWQVFRTPL